MMSVILQSLRWSPQLEIGTLNSRASGVSEAEQQKICPEEREGEKGKGEERERNRMGGGGEKEMIKEEGWGRERSRLI